jgi:hypothetical protein
MGGDFTMKKNSVVTGYMSKELTMNTLEAAFSGKMMPQVKQKVLALADTIDISYFSLTRSLLLSLGSDSEALLLLNEPETITVEDQIEFSRCFGYYLHDLATTKSSSLSPFFNPEQYLEGHKLGWNHPSSERIYQKHFEELVNASTLTLENRDLFSKELGRLVINVILQNNSQYFAFDEFHAAFKDAINGIPNSQPLTMKGKRLQFEKMFNEILMIYPEDQ